MEDPKRRCEAVACGGVGPKLKVRSPLECGDPACRGDGTNQGPADEPIGDRCAAIAGAWEPKGRPEKTPHPPSPSMFLKHL